MNIIFKTDDIGDKREKLMLFFSNFVKRLMECNSRLIFCVVFIFRRRQADNSKTV